MLALEASEELVVVLVILAVLDALAEFVVADHGRGRGHAGHWGLERYRADMLSKLGVGRAFEQHLLIGEVYLLDEGVCTL